MHDLKIRVETPLSGDAKDLLDGSTASLLRHMPAEEIFTVDAEELCIPNASFFVARIGKLPVGCVALVDMTDYGEIKRLYVRDTFRGQGVARALLEDVEQFCRDVGLQEIKLESSPLLTGAAKLYRAMGYQECDAFGDYPVLDSSLFMSKRLSALD